MEEPRDGQEVRLTFAQAALIVGNVRRRVPEKIDDAGFQRVLGADDDEAVTLNQLLEHVRPVA